MPDFVPSPDDNFDQWSGDLVKYLTTDATAPARSAAEKKALTDGLAAWKAAYGTHLQAQTDATTAAQGKDDTRSDFEATLRKQIGDIQRDDATSDAQRTAMKVTVLKTGRTPVGEIDTHPVIQKIDTSTRLRHRLFFGDSDTPDSTAKPDGAKFCAIRMQLGGAKPTDPDTMTELAMESRAPQ